MLKRWWRTLLLLTGLLTGCHGAPTRPGVLVYAGDWQMPPAYRGNPWNPEGLGVTSGFVFEPLFVYLPQTRQYRPRLGTSFAEAADGRTLTVKLQPQVLWHDGRPFSSADVQATFYLAGLFNNRVWRYLDAVDCPDPTTVVFRWKQYEATNTLRALTEPITSPRHLYQQWSDAARAWIGQGRSEAAAIPLRSAVLGFHPETPVGTGPFRVQSVSPSDMVLRRFDRHYQAALVHVPEIRIARWPSNQVVWGYLRAGEMDVGTPACPADVMDDLLEKNPHLRTTMVPDRNEFGVGFNCGLPLLRDVRVRQALTRLLDRDQIRQICCSAGLTVDDYSVGLVRSRRDDWLPPAFYRTLTRNGYDPDGAARLLGAAGLVRRAGQWCDSGGPIHLEVLAPNVMSDVVLLADAVTSQWRRAGLDAEVRIVPFDRYNGMIAGGQFDVVAGYGARLGKFDDPGSSLENLFAPTSPFRQGAGLPPTRDGVNTIELWNSLDTIQDASARQTALERLCRMANEEVTFTACYEKQTVLFVQDGVRVSGWDLADPVWSAIPGGAETALTTVLLEGKVHPAPLP